MQFTQIEMTQVAEPPPPEPEPEPEPEVVEEPEPEPLPEPEEADIALEEIVEEPKPEAIPEPEPVQEEAEVVAQVTQEASAPEPVVNVDQVGAWVRSVVEKEKSYPKAASRAGYEGEYQIRVTVGANGVIESADILSGRGHPLLKRTVARMLKKLPGQSYGQPVGEVREFKTSVGFYLNESSY